MPSFPTFGKRRKMRNDDEGSDGLWGINFGCIAVGPKLGWGHFSSAPNAQKTLSCFSAFLVGKLPGASSFVPAADFLIGDLHPIQSSTASPFFPEYHKHTKPNESLQSKNDFLIKVHIWTNGLAKWLPLFDHCEYHTHAKSNVK